VTCAATQNGTNSRSRETWYPAPAEAKNLTRGRKPPSPVWKEEQRVRTVGWMGKGPAEAGSGRRRDSQISQI
jgi:hypothetical protein